MYGDQLIKNILMCYLRRDRFKVQNIIRGGFELDFRDASMSTNELIAWIKVYEPRASPPTTLASNGEKQVAGEERPGALPLDASVKKTRQQPTNKRKNKR